MTADLLKGVRIVELGQYIPAPYAALTLCDLGADVVKIEPPRGDPMRHIGSARVDDVSVAYAAMNGGKRVVFADLKSAVGQQEARALIARADVLIESFRPGVLDRLGLDRATLAALNPGLVHCAISGFGQNGPMAQKAAHDLNYMAAGGGLSYSGTAERPVMTRPPVSDYAGALQGALSILAALLRRARTGQGCYLDISMTDVVLAWQAPSLSEAILAPEALARGADPDTGGLASYNIYAAACGNFVTLAAEEAVFWEKFCRAIGREDLVSRRLEPVPQHGLIAEVARVFATHTALEWEARLAGTDCCFQRVLAAEEALDFPQFAARGLIERVEGGAVSVRYPAWIDDERPAARRPRRTGTLGEAVAAWSEASGVGPTDA